MSQQVKNQCFKIECNVMLVQNLLGHLVCTMTPIHCSVSNPKIGEGLTLSLFAPLKPL